MNGEQPHELEQLAADLLSARSVEDCALLLRRRMDSVPTEQRESYLIEFVGFLAYTTRLVVLGGADVGIDVHASQAGYDRDRFDNITRGLDI